MTMLGAPPAVEAVFDRVGQVWTGAERERVAEWLVTPPPIGQLLLYTARHLGSGTTAADAADTLRGFFATQLDGTIRLYDPARGLRFQAYLLMRLRQVSWKEGHRIRERREEPLVRRDGDGEAFEFELADPNAATERDIVNRLTLQQLFTSMLPSHREAVLKYYFEGKSVREIAVELGTSEENVKIRLFRGRHWLRERLAQA